MAIAVPLIAAAQSPLLQWREPVHLIAGFSGIAGLALLLVQPLLIAGLLPDVPARGVHVWSGAGLVLAMVVHVAGLWITSPRDVIDVLLCPLQAPCRPAAPRRRGIAAESLPSGRDPDRALCEPLCGPTFRPCSF